MAVCIAGAREEAGEYENRRKESKGCWYVINVYLKEIKYVAVILAYNPLALSS